MKNGDYKMVKSNLKVKCQRKSCIFHDDLFFCTRTTFSMDENGKCEDYDEVNLSRGAYYRRRVDIDTFSSTNPGKPRR